MTRQLRILSHALRLLPLIRQVPSSVTVVVATGDTSEETYRITWQQGNNKYVVHSPDNAAPSLENLVKWITAGAKYVLVIQLDTYNTHFNGEHEVATLFYHKALKQSRPTQYSSGHLSRQLRHP